MGVSYSGGSHVGDIAFGGDDFGPQKDLRPADDLAAVMGVLGHVLGATAIGLSMHPTDSPARLVASVPRDGEPAAELVREFGTKLLEGRGPIRPRWFPGIGGDGELLLVVLDEVPGHSRMALGFHFERPTREQKQRADAYVARQPFADGYFDVWQLSRLRARRCAALEEALNRSDDGVVLISRSTNILFANEAAEAIMASGQGIRRVNDSIRATSLADSVNLQLTLEHVVAAAVEGSGAHPVGGQVLALRRRAGPPLLALVIPSETPPLEPTDAAAVMYLADPKLDPGRMLLPICQVYRLSPVETALAGHLVAGRSLSVAAQAMKVKEPTARTYLKNIFIKTSTNRQAELVALLLGSLVHVKQSAFPH